ncbi:MAG: hypothetical protein A3K66_03930 [Euryarchaeota archaeon RBG_16_67_27]|nr:MAG: hypothetical protein A3K66_03930 [Euryarchaeota archaeon RBG_16_67_27]
MAAPRAILRRIGGGSAFVVLGVILLGVRFFAPTLAALLGVQGVDVSGLDAGFTWYSGLLPLVLIPFAGIVLRTWPGGFRWDARSVLASALTAAVGTLWVASLDSPLRVLASPWTSLILGAAAAAAIASWDIALGGALVRAGATDGTLLGFRALGIGYAVAFFLWSARFVDYGYELGVEFPGVLTRLLDYGPSLLLSFLSIAFWIEISVLGPSRSLLRAFGPPVGFALVGLALSEGLGGFIFSHVLTWGGSYALFAPSYVSLPVVMFAIGAFVAVSWTLRSRMPRAAWRSLTGGILCIALAGILPLGGAFPSLAGIVLGLVVATRGLLGAGEAGVSAR